MCQEMAHSINLLASPPSRHYPVSPSENYLPSTLEFLVLSSGPYLYTLSTVPLEGSGHHDSSPAHTSVDTQPCTKGWVGTLLCPRDQMQTQLLGVKSFWGCWVREASISQAWESHAGQGVRGLALLGQIRANFCCNELEWGIQPCGPFLLLGGSKQPFQCASSILLLPVVDFRTVLFLFLVFSFF